MNDAWPEIRAWRKAERARLIEARVAAARERRAWSTSIETALETRLPFLANALVGFYWPFKGEFDARPLVRRLHGRGARFALPVVVEKAAPLVFRAWAPGDRLEPGIWQIPVPVEDRQVEPDLLLVPLVGFDAQGFRLGYGGGYYDRTIAKFGRRPLAIGIGFELSAIATIHPQPHDIPMDMIVTEASLRQVTGGGLVAAGQTPTDAEIRRHRAESGAPA
ncbi:MAG: 5-formyltetrahydrofolate cyclo-ligase [Alphaproteobacteria bacterium]|nr:MAG: 5-formyltetrahydrofolate cyclo-ligase [Alphaproteobacteria bacterium]